MHVVFCSSHDPQALLGQARRLKLAPCPFCHRSGHLLCHGVRMGYVGGQ